MNSNLIYWSPGVTLEAVEKQVIKMAMRAHGNVKLHAARDLGIAIRTLDAKLEVYAIDEKAEAVIAEAEKAEAARQLARARGISFAPSPPAAQVPSPQAPSHQAAKAKTAAK